MSSGGRNPPQLHFDDGSRIILNNPASSSSSKNRDNIRSHDHDKQDKQITTTATITNPRGDIPIPIYYEIERIAQEIVQDIIPKITKAPTASNTTATESNNGFLCRVALQFPDELLDDSTQVSWLMEEAIVTHYHQHQCNVHDEKDNDNADGTIIPSPPLVFVLGDTTYASCCPDEIGGLHLNADVIVHYGQYACLSVSDSLDVIYSFGVQEWLEDEMISCVESIVGQIIESSLMQSVKEKIILVGERRYQHHLGLLSELLWKKGEEVVDHVVVGTVPKSIGKKHTLTSCGGGGGHGTCGGMNPCCQQESTPCYDDNDHDVVIEPQQGDKESESESESSILGGLHVAIPPSQLSQYILVYIGDDTGTCKSRQYLNTLLKCTSPHSHTKSFWSYNPITQTLSTSITTNNSNAAISRYLNRRFYLIQKAKLANIYGILVGTLSQDRFRSVIASIRHKILQSGRTCYTFVVGKINIAKIANFAEVECFVLVACGETSVLRDEREFHVPIVTPMELEIALGEKEWDGAASCSTDFTDFLQTCAHKNVKEEEKDGVGDNEHGDNNKNQDDNHEDDDDDNDDDDKPFYSMISGTYVSRPTSSLQPNNIKNLDDHSNDSTTENNNDMSSIPGQGQLTKYHSAAAEFWKKREYKGLEANIGRNDANAAIQGQSGIASDYGK